MRHIDDAELDVSEVFSQNRIKAKENKKNANVNKPGSNERIRFDSGVR